MLESSVNTSSKFSAEEKSLTARLSGLFSIRMLGVFIILPILATYSESLTGTNPLLTGFVFASYAITQILLQPIFGIVSDKIGRKPALITGLALFTFGSIVLMFASSVYVAILGRVIQGSGAVSAVVLALATDLTREQIRSKVMAFIGVSIGITFGIAISISPLIYFLAKGYGIFGLCAALGVAGIYITIKYIPDIPYTPKDKQAPKESLSTLTKIAFEEKNVIRLYFGAFLLHLLLTMTFATLPSFFAKLDISSAASAIYYTITFFISIIIMFIFVGLAERFYKHRILFLFAIILLSISYLTLVLSSDATSNHWMMICSLVLFFCGFNIMEASQPSLMSRFANKQYRGTIMGMFSSSQFLGASIGGILGSTISGYLSENYVFYLAFILSAVWFAIAWPMQNPIKPSPTEAETN